MFSGREEYCALVAQVDLHSRFHFQLMDKLGIHAGACRRQRLKSRESFKRAVDQHSAGGVRGFAARLSALDHEDASPTSTQRAGQREADSASADDDYVRSLHLGIVQRGGGPELIP
jgi:hypothetical protein